MVATWEHVSQNNWGAISSAGEEGLSVITPRSRTSSEISWWPISSTFDLNDMRVHTTFTEIKPRVISISDLSICRPQVHPHCSQQLAFFFLLFAVYTISSCKIKFTSMHICVLKHTATIFSFVHTQI